MYLNWSLLITFVVLSFTSIDALVESWNERSSDGQTSCNYTYTYKKGRDFDAIEEVISDSFECGDSSASCTSTLNYNRTFNTKLSGLNNLDPRNFEKTLGRANVIARNVGISYQSPRLKDGTFSCTINPGYRVMIVTKPRFHRLTGTLEEKCLTSCKGCVVTVHSIPLNFEIPAKSNNDDRIAGSISCKVEPAANINDMTRICNPQKLTSGKMFDAVGDALHKAALNTALNGAKTLEHTNIDGNDVWSIGMCWNGLGRDACRACVRYLVDSIWSECENSRGAQLWVTDCGVRYEFSRLTTGNYDESFLEQSN